MTELVETGVEAPEQGAAQPEAKAAPAEVKVVSEDEQRARDESALDDKLRKVFREAKREREDDGKFASKDKKTVPNADEVAAQKSAPAKDAKEPAQKAETKDQKPDKAAEPDAAKLEKPAEKPAIKRPTSWSADKDALWETLSPEAREHVAKREQEAHKAISQLGETVKRMEPIGRLLEQHRDTFQSKGLSYDQGLSQLLSAQRALDQNPAAALKQIADAYGVDLSRLAQGQGQQADPQVSALQQQVSTLTRQLSEFQSRAEHQARAEAQTKLGAIEQVIERFAADKPDFESLASDIEALLPALRQRNPTVPFEQIIQDAYEQARWSNPASRQRLLDEKAKSEEKARVEAAKKAAEDAKAASAINVGGAQAPSGEQGDLDDMLRGIVRRNKAA